MPVPASRTLSKPRLGDSSKRRSPPDAPPGSPSTTLLKPRASYVATNSTGFAPRPRSRSLSTGSSPPRSVACRSDPSSQSLAAASQHDDRRWALRRGGKAPGRRPGDDGPEAGEQPDASRLDDHALTRRRPGPAYPWGTSALGRPPAEILRAASIACLVRSSSSGKRCP